MKAYKFFIFIVIALMAIANGASAQQENKIIMLMLKPKEAITDDYKLLLFLNTEFEEEALHLKNNPNLQEDMVKFMFSTSDSDDSVTVALLNKVKPAKTVEEALDILENLDGYDATHIDTSELSEEKEKIFWQIIGNFFELVRDENGNVAFDREKPIHNSHIVERRIIVSEYDGVIEMEVRSDKYNDPRTSYNSNTGERIPALEYTQTDTENDLGDKLKVIKFQKINGRYNSREIVIPMELKGCANTEKIRNRMLEVMFGTSNGDILELAANNVTDWVVNHRRGVYMHFFPGQGLVSFGFENRDIYDNSQNTFIVFDKASGDEITADQLIKDKEGFIKFVNSHNYYMEGFLIDTTESTTHKHKFGDDMRSYLRHSVHFTTFDGLKQFPTSWWFVPNKIDEIVPVEFNTPDIRIFLDYADISEFIDPKYRKIMDNAAKYSIQRK